MCVSTTAQQVSAKSAKGGCDAYDLCVPLPRQRRPPRPNKPVPSSRSDVGSGTGDEPAANPVSPLVAPGGIYGVPSVLYTPIWAAT